MKTFNRQEKFRILQKAFAVDPRVAISLAETLALGGDEDAVYWVKQVNMVVREQNVAPPTDHGLKPGDKVIVDLVFSDAYGMEAEVIRVIPPEDAKVSANPARTDEGWIEVTSPTGLPSGNVNRGGSWVFMPQWLVKVEALQPTPKDELNKPVGWDELEKLGWKPDSK